MKIIEAMKKVKANRAKIDDLMQKIAHNSAHLSFETSPYDDPKGKVSSWLQSCEDLNQEIIKLLTAIQRTNLNTSVTIEIGDKSVTKTIAEWVWRRREFAGLDKRVWQSLTDRNLKEGKSQTSTGIDLDVKVIRNYDQQLKDKKVDEFASELGAIDAKLEVVNAVTDIIDDKQ